MNDIVRKTNRYATTPDAEEKILGGANWEQFTIGDFKAFMAMV